MNVLIIYASNSGNTLMTTERIAAVLRRAGHTVMIQDVATARPAQLAEHQAVIFGSCTWLRQTPAGPQEGSLPEQFFQFTVGVPREHQLAGKPCAVFALGRHEYTHFARAADALEQFISELDGKLAVDSLRLDGFPHHQQEATEEWAQGLSDALGKSQNSSPERAKSVPVNRSESEW